MRYGKITVMLVTLLFAALAVILWAFEPQVETMPVDLILAAAEEKRTVTGWKNEDGEYFLFLPGYADLASARLRIHADEVWIDGRLAEDGMSCGEFVPDEAYSFSFTSSEGQVSTALTFVQSENLPTLYIDTGSGSMDYIHSKKGNQETGTMSLYLPDGELSYIGNLDAINGRGNDWLIPKKSYSLQLAAGTDLLGMGKAEKWILQANAFDASHLRNKLVYDFADALGLDYSPESRWVDMYLNGEYAGLYLLCERNELHEQRVSLEGEGQYLVSMDVGWRLEQNHRPFVNTEAGYAFRIHSSQLGEMTVLRLLQSVENAISAVDGRDSVTGKHWTELIDLDSWAKKYLVEEIFGNGDGGAISQYFYGCGQEHPMYAGPVWDYDVSMGNTLGLCGGNPQSIFASRPRIWSDVSISWFYELNRQEIFRERMLQAYQEDCLPLLERFLNVQMDEYLSQIVQAAAMNQLRWTSLASSQTSATAEVAYIRNFMEQRIRFLNEYWLEQKTFHRVLIDAGDGQGTRYVAVLPGEQIPALPEYAESWEILGWYDAATEEPFDPSQPITRDTVVYLKKLPGEEEGISPLQAAPIGAVAVILLCVMLVDRKRQRMQQKKTEKSIAKQKIT